MGHDPQQHSSDAEHREFGETIRAARRGCRLSQAALAKAVGVSPVHISQIETAQRIPSDRVAKDIAIALGLHWQDVLRLVYALRSRDARELFVPGEPGQERQHVVVTDIPAVRSLLLRLAGLDLSQRELDTILRNWANALDLIGQVPRVNDRAQVNE